MTVRAWPLDVSGGSPSYTGRYLRQTTNAWIAGRTSARPLGARSGIFPGMGTPVSVSGSTATVTACAGVADVQALAIAGPYIWSVDASVNLTVDAAAAGPRIDLVYVTINDNAEDSSGSENPVVGYLAGTAAGVSGTPSPPATPARSLVLAQLNVPASGGGSTTVTMVAPYVTATGGILPARTLAEFPSAPHVGKYVDHATLGLFRGNGTDFSPPLTMVWKYSRAAAVTIGSGGSPTTITPDTTLSDSAGIGLASSGFVSPCAMSVRATAYATFAGAAGGMRLVRVMQNGAAVPFGGAQLAGTADGPLIFQSGSPTIVLALNDVITMQVQQTSGGSLTLSGAMLEVVKA